MGTIVSKEQVFDRGAPDGFINRLFFQARNLAIEAMLLRLENALLREGHVVRCLWNESSFPGVSVSIEYPNPKPKENSWEYATCTSG